MGNIPVFIRQFPVSHADSDGLGCTCLALDTWLSVCVFSQPALPALGRFSVLVLGPGLELSSVRRMLLSVDPWAFLFSGLLPGDTAPPSRWALSGTV